MSKLRFKQGGALIEQRAKKLNRMFSGKAGVVRVFVDHSQSANTIKIVTDDTESMQSFNVQKRAFHLATPFATALSHVSEFVRDEPEIAMEDVTNENKDLYVLQQFSNIPQQLQ